MPRISVIMSVYNEPIDWLRQSIDSVLGQSYSDFEFIIVCDNPDYIEGISLLNDYAQRDKRIILVFNDVNIGLTKSLNKGIAVARGEYIARMDADDISRKDRLKVQYGFLRSHSEVDVCGSNFKFFGNVSLFSNKKGNRPLTNEEIIAYMTCMNPIAHPTVMMKKIICGAPFYYDESVQKAQDYKLWYDLYKRGAVFHNLKERLLYYRISSTQITKSSRGLQNITANNVRSNFLEEIGRTSEYDKELHNEVFNIIKSDKPLVDKLNWILLLLDQHPSIKKGAYRSLMWLYYVKTCLLYSETKHINRKWKEIISNIGVGSLVRLLVTYKIRRTL